MSAQESIRESSQPLHVHWLGPVDYTEMWHKQAELADARAAAQSGSDAERDQLLLLEHPATYTAGRRTQPEDLPDDGTPVIDVDRGGRITWHGPGQLVGYPIVKLSDPVDVVDYVRRLEEALIHVCHQLGVTAAGRIEGRSGVWLPPAVVGNELLPERKIAALGLRVTKRVTMHGFALNCDNSLDAYRHIVPCGIDDAGVTTLSQELQRDVTVEEVREPVITAVQHALDGTLPVIPHALPDDGHARKKVQ